MKQPEQPNLLRLLPRVDDVMADLRHSFPDISEHSLKTAARTAITRQREQRQAAQENGAALDKDTLRATVVQTATAQLQQQEYSSPRRVLNGTGIVIHTGLGRSLLSQSATAAVTRVAAAHCALEVDIESGERGRRDTAVAALLREITGCEDATVCNNCAGATLLALNTLAQGREVICARGELVEIGGAFRMPNVMSQSGATLREVGCTNKTRISDYSDAIGEATGALLKVHTSNYRIVGFTAEVTLADMVKLGRERGVPVIEDLGSGVLVDLRRCGLEGEPRVQESVRAGADIVCFSGDKLLGGPQCGVLCGTREAIARVRKNPLLRALRVDKFTLAALEATLRHYRDEDEAWREIPTLRALAAPPAEVKQRAQKLARLLQRRNVPAAVSVVASQAQAGAGSLPTETLPSFAVAIAPSVVSSDELARHLRQGEPSVWGRIRHDALLLDCRTLRDDELKECATRVQAVL